MEQIAPEKVGPANWLPQTPGRRVPRRAHWSHELYPPLPKCQRLTFLLKSSKAFHSDGTEIIILHNNLHIRTWY